MSCDGNGGVQRWSPEPTTSSSRSPSIRLPGPTPSSWERSLDAPTETKLFSGPGGDQLNTSATFQVTPDLFVVATAAVTTTCPAPATCNGTLTEWAYNPVTADQNIGPLEELRLTFEDADGDTQPLKSASFTLVDLGRIPGPPGLPQQVEVAVYRTYLNGLLVGNGTVLGDADGTVTLDITSPTSFDSIVLTAGSKSTQYQAERHRGSRRAPDLHGPGHGRRRRHHDDRV